MSYGYNSQTCAPFVLKSRGGNQLWICFSRAVCRHVECHFDFLDHWEAKYGRVFKCVTKVGQIKPCRWCQAILGRFFECAFTTSQHFGDQLSTWVGFDHDKACSVNLSYLQYSPNLLAFSPDLHLPKIKEGTDFCCSGLSQSPTVMQIHISYLWRCIHFFWAPLSREMSELEALAGS